MVDPAKGRRSADWPEKSRPVPPKDYQRNDYAEDVGGNKTDVAVISPTSSGSLVAYAKGGLNQLANILGLIGKEYDLSKNEVTWSDIDGRVVFTAGISHKDFGYVPSVDIFPGCITLLQYRGDAEPTQILGEDEIEDEEFIGDGETTTFTLAHTPTTSISEITIDGEPTVDYTFDMITGVVTFDTAPGDEAVILITYFYGVICSKANGRIYYPYTFGDGVWLTDDQFYVRIDYAHITIGGTIYYLPPMEWMGTIQDTSTIVGMLDTIDSLVDGIDGKCDDILEDTGTTIPTQIGTHDTDVKTLIGTPVTDLASDIADADAQVITSEGVIIDAIVNHDAEIKALIGEPIASLATDIQDIYKNELIKTGYLPEVIAPAIAAIPTNPMLDTEDGSSFTAIPDMALDSTVAKDATAAKEATLGVPVTSVSADVAAVKTVADGIKTQTDKLAGEAPVKGTATEDWFAAEANIVSLGTNDIKHKLLSCFISLHNITAASIITIRMYLPINDTDRKIFEKTYTKGIDPDGIPLVVNHFGIHEVLRITAQSNAVADNGKGIDYDYMLEAM